MYRILKKRVLSPNVKLMVIDAPHVAKKALAGQFIMLRIDEDGERIPLTIADYDRSTGEVTIMFQEVGKTTKQLGLMNEGDALADFVGPLGVASHFEGVKRAAVIGGGLGTAIAYPQAKALKEHGAHVDMIVGFRNKELIMLEDEFASVSDRLFVTTDDGSNGKKGFVSDVLRTLLEAGETYDLVVAIGPVMMMKVVSDMTRPYNIHTVVSMNSIMVDGTGMCGCCRVTVGGETKFACVDGPDFDGHLVDFDEAMRRGAMYRKEEAESLERHVCRLTGEVRNG
ncbi:MAG TPA: sulfide/dihydroorotate dehydrogenase-like FAD/NAD-binding protein [Clostridia bacterium]|nr:sulfide/dihydroorotate dehydrogenase-like FAD/NAD-binding protein [Clostridia bacterium]